MDGNNLQGSRDQNYGMGENINRMSSYLENVLIENREELIRQLKSSEIINSLFQRRVIDLDDMQDIKKEEERKGRRAGVEKLLDKIHSSGSYGFNMFVESLRCNGYTNLVNILLDSYHSITNRAEERAIASRIRLKATENIPDFEKIGVKRRGKIPEKHEEILRDSYRELMREIRINNIMDYLFTNQLVDWNEMDAIKTRLRSEGNREALDFFISEVLLFSADQALPTFILCLRQAGYSEIAQRLQDDMDRQ